MKYSAEWQSINSNTQRMRVPNGWIVQSFTNLSYSMNGISLAMTFISDPNGEWVVEPYKWGDCVVSEEFEPSLEPV
jgi:hypothetical protein